MTGEIEIKVSPNWFRWEQGFGSLGREIVPQAQHEFEAAAKAFFDATQGFVHVISGRLKASGDYEVQGSVSEGDVTMQVTYDAPYAIYEQVRGGSHAFMTRAWEQTAELFDGAMTEAWTKVVESWR